MSNIEETLPGSAISSWGALFTKESGSLSLPEIINREIISTENN